MPDAAVPAISILLPTYNGDRFLREQLDSILAQTWTDFELLIVDDGSTDATREILAAYAEKDARMRLVPSEGNRGQKPRLVELLELAQGQLIAISDQDDTWEAHKLERLTRNLGSAALAFGRSELIDDQGNALQRTLLDVLGSRHCPGDRLALLFRPQVSGHAMLARREIVTADAFESDQPYDWLISIIAEFSRGMVYVDDAIVFHRLHGTNAHNVNVLARLNVLRLRTRHLRDFLTRTKRRRQRVLEGLSRLAQSDHVPEENRTLFRELDAICRPAWLDPARKVPPGELRKAMLAVLRPHAGSSHDWRTVVDHVTALAYGMSHPFTLVRLNRLL